jgi:hypothetical protein
MRAMEMKTLMAGVNYDVSITSLVLFFALHFARDVFPPTKAERNFEIHRKRIQGVKKCVDNSMPYSYGNRNNNTRINKKLIARQGNFPSSYSLTIVTLLPSAFCLC